MNVSFDGFDRPGGPVNTDGHYRNVAVEVLVVILAPIPGQTQFKIQPEVPAVGRIERLAKLPRVIVLLEENEMRVMHVEPCPVAICHLLRIGVRSLRFGSFCPLRRQRGYKDRLTARQHAFGEVLRWQIA